MEQVECGGLAEKVERESCVESQTAARAEIKSSAESVSSGWCACKTGYVHYIHCFHCRRERFSKVGCSRQSNNDITSLRDMTCLSKERVGGKEGTRML
jgi:hypothetical protein